MLKSFETFKIDNILNSLKQKDMENFEKITEFLESLGLNFEVQQLNDQITITLEDKKENRKEEFEALVNKMDDSLFEKTLKEANIQDLNKRYKEVPDEVIEEFLQKGMEVLDRKITELENLYDEFSAFLED